MQRTRIRRQSRIRALRLRIPKLVHVTGQLVRQSFEFSADNAKDGLGSDKIAVGRNSL